LPNRAVPAVPFAYGFLAYAFLVLVAGTAEAAQNSIGNTVIARKSVSQITPTKASPIQLGDDVFINEEVKTGVESAAKFVFSDQTNLALGPTSTVKLDRFVYKDDATYTKAAVNFAAGAFRFTTGGSDKGAYQLRTGTATIGVRGTIFDVSVRSSVTTVTLIEGEVVICPRSRFDGDPRKLSPAQLKHYGCTDLTKAGQTAKVTKRTASLSATPVNFAGNFCSGGDELCSVTTTTASASPTGIGPLDPNNPALCYVNQD
jgi:hypothetical protein